MQTERWRRLEELYHSTLEQKEDERFAFLERSCAGDEALRVEVESLIAYSRQTGRMIDQPAIQVVAAAIAEDLRTEGGLATDKATDKMIGARVAQYSIVEKLGGTGGWSQTFSYSFGFATNDGQSPGPGLVFANGSIYGTTGGGGSNLNCGTSGGSQAGCGTVFQLTPPAPGGAWAYAVVYNFGNNSGTIPDGQIPVGIIFSDNAIYGVTEDGGEYGEGRVFELNPTTWVETTLLDFPPNEGSNTNGAVPNVGVTADTAHNLFGTTSQGGPLNNGVVFELTPVRVRVGRTFQTVWEETVLHDFDESVDGDFPFGLTLDKAGNLYGTTLQGGAHNGGTAFELLVGPTTPWAETVLYNFCSVSVGSQDCTDGQFPSSGLVLDHADNPYGTTSQGRCFRPGNGVRDHLEQFRDIGFDGHRDPGSGKRSHEHDLDSGHWQLHGQRGVEGVRPAQRSDHIVQPQQHEQYQHLEAHGERHGKD